MGSFKVFDRRARRFVAAVALLAATVIPAAVPALASAATVTTRSIALSSSAKGTDNVGYTVKFTTSATATSTGAFIIDFCEDSAAIGATCDDTITGFDTSGVGTAAGNTVTSLDANTVKVVLGTPVAANSSVEVALTGIDNPDAAGALYARIVTYADDTAAGSYVDPDTLGTTLDDGAVALSITNDIGVSGAVLESLLFCASKDTITANCGGTMGLPSISLGTNGILGTTLSEGTIHTQISTNAAKGAVVNLKSNAVGCGGLIRDGASTACDIGPITVDGAVAAPIANDTAKFGVKLGVLSATTGTVVPEANYETTNYYMDYITDDETGVTSTYGSPVYSTNNLPVNNGAVDLTFGAATTNTTPAGNYSATLNLIATGTF